jgi:hypothetical protein
VHQAKWGLLVWGLGWIGLGFLPLELAAHFWPGCPWPTLSRTDWDLQSAWEPWRLAVLCFLFVLGLHLAFRLSAAALIVVAAAAVVAGVVHFLTGAV